MKKTIKAHSARLLALVLTLTVLMSSAAITASAFTFSVGMSYDDIGTVVSSSTSTIATGLEYSNTTYTDAKGYGQTLFAMEFNPKTTGYLPIMYQPKISYGSTVANSVAAARNEGYEVLGAINGEFFSMNSGNAGTLEGRIVTNGRIIADSENRDDVCLAIGSDGSFNLVQSEMVYHFYIEGKEVLNAEGGLPAIGTINKRYVGTNWWNPYCYFDYATGGNTYTNSSVPGVEVVFNKTEGTELIIEGVLQGEVVSVNTNTYGTAMGENQFVLYAQNGSVNYDSLANLKAGQKVQIYAEELNKDAKEIMKNAVTVTTATYPIVKNGVDNTLYTPNASDIYLTRAQRTGIGVKEDGTIVMLCTKGRGATSTYDKGITLPEMAKMMIALGCKYAVNLDGGGSSTMYAGNSLVYAAEGRAVASSMLICKRNSKITSDAAKQELNNWIYNASTSDYGEDQKAIVDAAIAEAQAVYDDNNAYTGSTDGDFLRETMDLKTAMGYIKSFTPKNYISLKADDWSYNTGILSATNDASGALVFNNTDGKWPTISYGCDVTVPADYKLYYDFTANGSTSIHITIGGTEIKLNPLIAPPSDLDANSQDINAYGKTYKGSVDVSAIKAGGGQLTSISIWSVGTAGVGSQVTVRDFGFRNPFSGGDVNGSGIVNSTDARMLLRWINGKITLSDAQIAAADINGDGQANSTDIRQMLLTRVGLA